MRLRHAFLVAAALCCAACTDQQPAAAPAPAPPAEVRVAKPVVERIVEWDAYTGRLEAVESVELRSRVSGHLRSTHFHEGQLVQEGDILFVIDPRPFEVAVNSARAALRERQADLSVARSARIQAEAEKTRIEAQVALARVRERRATGLREGGTLTQEALDERISERKQVEAQLGAATAAIESAKSAVERAGADVTTARVQLEGALLELSYSRVTAPITGRIDRRLVTPGNYVQGGASGGTLLTTIVSLDPIHCYFDANEQALLKYTRLARSGRRQSSREVKNPVFISLVDERGFPHSGHMDFVGNRLQRDTATIRARAIFANPDRVLQPGLFARVRIPGGAPYDAVMIPDSAVGADQSERFVLVVDPATQVVARRVIELGPKHGGLRVVRQGIDGSELVITDGVQLATPGSKISPTTVELEVHPNDDGLPDSYSPVPREQWLTRPVEPPPPSTSPTLPGEKEERQDESGTGSD